MTRGRITGLLALAAIASLGWWFFAPTGQDPEPFAELVGKQREKARQASGLNQSIEFKSSVENLTDQVLLLRNKVSGAFVVQQKNLSHPRIRLPFAPDNRGQLPSRQNRTTDTDPTRESSLADLTDHGFVGEAACAGCHPQNHAGFLETAHHKTSSLATPEKILGDLAAPGNQIDSDGQGLSFQIGRDDDSVFQTVKLADWQVDIPMDVITGSGKVAQTYLYWNGDALHEAFISYFSQSDSWLHSPGFDEQDVNYARIIRVECLECHVTYIAEKADPNIYHRDSAIWGVSCERCHGPGREHVQHHQANPDDPTAKHIIYPAELPRQRQLDICGQCHSGEFGFRQPAFSFRPGDELAKFHRPLKPDFDGGDIHTSNQLTRMKLSKCFTESEMTCTSCHNPHEFQRGNTKLFSQACLNCHQAKHCGMEPELGEKISNNCIDCHMPDSQIADLTDMQKKGLSLSMADHFIRVDQEATAKYLDAIGESLPSFVD